MSALNEEELKMFVDSVRRYFVKITASEPKITSAFLGTETVEGYDFTGVVTFSGTYQGQVMVSMPLRPLRELLLMQHETDTSDDNLLDTVGEIANTLAGNARKVFGNGLLISVPIKMKGKSGAKAKVRKHPYVITLNWFHQPALVCIDLERKD